MLEQSAQLAEATLQLLQDALDVDRLLRATDTRPDLLHRTANAKRTQPDVESAEMRDIEGQREM